MDGWLKLHRSLSDHWIFSFKEPDKALAWIDLLIMARHTSGTVMMKGRALQLNRGEVGVSQLALQKKWGWSQNKVKRFLVLLKKHSMIDYETNDLTTVISICNFESFQGGGRSDELLNERPDERTANDQTNEDIRKRERKKETTTYCDEFLSLWDQYPKRSGGNNKKAAYKACLARISDNVSWEQMQTGVIEYARYCQANGLTGSTFVKQTSTFCGPNNHFLDDWSVGSDPEVDIVVNIFNSEVVSPYSGIASVIDGDRIRNIKIFYASLKSDEAKIRDYFRYFFANSSDWHKGANQSGKPVSFDYIIDPKTLQRAMENNL